MSQAQGVSKRFLNMLIFFVRGVGESRYVEGVKTITRKLITDPANLLKPVVAGGCYTQALYYTGSQIR